jgi:hypothetical protein
MVPEFRNGQATMTADKDNLPRTPDDKVGVPLAPREDAARERPTPEGDGLDPTRYGDWEKNGRCIDF